MQSPYLLAAERLTNRLRKRDWLLANYRKLNRLHPKSGEIERRHRISRDEFLAEYYSANRPVDHHRHDGRLAGHAEVEPGLLLRSGSAIARSRCRPAGIPAPITRSSRTSSWGGSVSGISSRGCAPPDETNDFYLTANNASHNRSALAELWDDIVQIPEYLRADQPAGFFWMGPAGTITPFHHDLTNNFMAQVIGRKRVKLAPSWDLPLMNNYHHCFSQVDGRGLAPAPHPDFVQPQILDCVLHPGEILFLPIGCLHFVQGLDITVTVSFTNFVFDNDFHSYYANYGPV